METKMVVFDIDGTIYYHHDHDFIASTRYTLEQLKANGYQIVVATSRCRKEVENLPQFFRDFNFDYEIYDGGALILKNGHLLEAHPVDKKDLEAVKEYTRKQQIFFRYSTFDDDFYDAYKDSKAIDTFFELYLMYPSFKPYQDDDAYNLLVFSQTPQQCDEIIALTKNSSYVRHEPCLVEITSDNGGKHVAIKRICDDANIDIAQVICFGDGANDALMLESCGYGVALGDSNKMAMQAANEVCDRIENDGIYKACLKLGLIKEGDFNGN